MPTKWHLFHWGDDNNFINPLATGQGFPAIFRQTKWLPSSSSLGSRLHDFGNETVILEIRFFEKTGKSYVIGVVMVMSQLFSTNQHFSKSTMKPPTSYMRFSLVFSRNSPNLPNKALRVIQTQCLAWMLQSDSDVFQMGHKNMQQMYFAWKHI